MSMDQGEMISRFSRIYSGAVSDVLDQMGFRNQVLPRSLHGLTLEAKVCGLALPVLGEPSTVTDADEIFTPVLRMLGDVKPLDVVVTRANDQSCSHLGELSATAIQSRGGAGAVIYGGVRDVDYIQKLGLPVFCRYTTPADIVGRWRLVEYNVAMQIEDVTVHPRDIVLGDKDGVLVVPQDIAEEVLIASEQIVGTESHVRSAVKNGMHPLDAYQKYGWF